MLWNNQLHKRQRLKLTTAQVLNRSRIKHLVIFGKEKRTALEKAIDLPNRLAPISAILPGASVHWAA